MIDEQNIVRPNLKENNNLYESNIKANDLFKLSQTQLGKNFNRKDYNTYNTENKLSCELKERKDGKSFGESDYFKKKNKNKIQINLFGKNEISTERKLNCKKNLSLIDYSRINTEIIKATDLETFSRNLWLVLLMLRSASVYLMFHIAVDLKQLQTGVTINTDQEIRQALPAAAELVEHLVPETDIGVIFDRAAIIDLADIGPENRVQAHRARFSCGIQFTSGQIVAVQRILGIADRGDLTVGGGILLLKHHVVKKALRGPERCRQVLP